MHTEYGAVPAACALNGSRFMGREIAVATSTPLNKDTGAQALQDLRMELDGGMMPGGGLEQGGGGPGGYQQQQQRGGHSRGRGGGRGGPRHQQDRRQQQQHPEPEPGKPVEGCWFCLSSEQVGLPVQRTSGGWS